MRKTDIKTNNYGVLGNVVWYRHAENVMGQEKGKATLVWEVGERFPEITLDLALKSEKDLNQSKKNKNTLGNGPVPKAL